MLFRPLELAWGIQKGFTIFSFYWNNPEQYYAFIGIIYEEDTNLLHITLFFKGWLIEWGD